MVQVSGSQSTGSKLSKEFGKANNNPVTSIASQLVPFVGMNVGTSKVFDSGREARGHGANATLATVRTTIAPSFVQGAWTADVQYTRSVEVSMSASRYMSDDPAGGHGACVFGSSGGL